MTEAAFGDVLLKDETLVWVARPDPFAGVTPLKLALGMAALLAALWGSADLMRLAIAWASHSGTFFPWFLVGGQQRLVVAAVLALGGAWCVWQVAATPLRLRHFVYGLSEKRAFAAFGAPGHRVVLAGRIAQGGMIATRVDGAAHSVRFDVVESANDRKVMMFEFENLKKDKFDAALGVLKPLMNEAADDRDTDDD